MELGLGLHYGDEAEMSERNPKERRDHPCTSNPNIDLQIHLHSHPLELYQVHQLAMQNTTPAKESNIIAVHDGHLTTLSMGQHIHHRSSTLELDQNLDPNLSTPYCNEANSQIAQPSLVFDQNPNPSLSTLHCHEANSHIAQPYPGPEYRQPYKMSTHHNLSYKMLPYHLNLSKHQPTIHYMGQEITHSDQRLTDQGLTPNLIPY